MPIKPYLFLRWFELIKRFIAEIHLNPDSLSQDEATFISTRLI